MEITVDVKLLFFDRAAVIKAIGKTAAANLSKGGAFIRQEARQSLRRRKRSASPGEPPSTHSKSGDFASLKNILFAWDSATKSVAVGPVLLNRSRQKFVETPFLMEKGGSQEIEEFAVGNKWLHRGQIVEEFGEGNLKYVLNHDHGKRRRLAKYAPHPFMGPAAKRVLASGKIISVWAR